MPIEYLDDIEEDITEAADTTPVEQPPVAGISEPVAPEPSGEFGGRIEYIEEEPLETEPPKDNSWDTLRGLEVSMRQVPQLAYGVAGLVGETAEQLTGYGESLRDWGFRGYQDWAESMEPISKETDDVTVAWNRAKEGDVGALVDWAQYGIGYALGQLGETAAVAVLGGLAGGAAGLAGGPTAIPAAAGGTVVAAAGKTGFKALAKNLVEKAISAQAQNIVKKQAAKEGIELTGEQLAKRAQQEAIKRQAGKEIGSNAAVFANAIGMQLGSIYGSAEEQARAEGRELTGLDLARIWGTGVATGGLEGVVDKFGLDLLKGKFAEALPAGRLAGAAVAGGVGTVGETATEAVQTVGERFGAGKDILSDEAINEYINASALGGIGGGVIGGVGGFVSGNPKENAAAKAKVSSEANKDVAPATAETVARQADAVIAETVQETPEQRVARLQEEATAAAGIELEEEPVVGVEPTVPVTPPVEPTPEGAVAPVEPVVTPEVAEPQPAAEVAAGTKEEQDLRAAQERVRKAQEVVDRVRDLPEDNPEVMAAYTERTESRNNLIRAEVAARHPNSKNISREEEEFLAPLQALAPLRPTEEPLTEGKQWRKGEEVGYNENVGTITKAIPPEGQPNILYRAVTKEDYERILAAGQIDSDMRGAITPDEGINLTPKTNTAAYYLPRGETGVILAIDTTGLDLNFIQSDSYVRSFKPIPADKIVGRSDFIHKDAETGQYLLRPQDNAPVTNEPASIVNYTKAAPTPEAAPAVTPPAEVEPTPEAVATTPEAPNLEPLRRVARAEQAPEDVPSLVEAGLVEMYKDQPVLTEAGIAKLPEAERPRLTPEARKIQIDTGSNEVVAEAIAKNLRIGVDQVGTDVRMPAGWTLVEDIYVPPAPQEVAKAEEPVAPKQKVDAQGKPVLDWEKKKMGRDSWQEATYEFSDPALPVDKITFQIEYAGRRTGGYMIKWDAFKDGKMVQIDFKEITIPRDASGFTYPSATTSTAAKELVVNAISGLLTGGQYDLATLSTVRAAAGLDAVKLISQTTGEYQQLAQAILDAANRDKEIMFALTGTTFARNTLTKGRFKNRSYYSPKWRSIRMTAKNAGDPKIVMHEVMHALLEHKLPSYLATEGVRGKKYKQALDKALKDKSIPTPLKDIIRGYLLAAEKLGAEEILWGEGPLRGTYAQTIYRSAKYLGASGLRNPTKAQREGGQLFEIEGMTTVKRVLQYLKENGITEVDVNRQGAKQYDLIIAKSDLEKIETPKEQRQKFGAKGYDPDQGYLSWIVRDRRPPIANNPDAVVDYGFEYGIGNLSEFLSEAFSKPEFQKILNEIPMESGRTIWQTIVDALAKILGMTVKQGSVLDVISRSALELAGTPDVLLAGGRTPSPAPEVRESRREPAPLTQQDREYLDAVERGDLDAASRAVKDAAKKAAQQEISKSQFTAKTFSAEEKVLKRLYAKWKSFDPSAKTNETLSGLSEFLKSRLGLSIDFGSRAFPEANSQTWEQDISGAYPQLAAWIRLGELNIGADSELNRAINAAPLDIAGEVGVEPPAVGGDFSIGLRNRAIQNSQERIELVDSLQERYRGVYSDQELLGIADRIYADLQYAMYRNTPIGKSIEEKYARLYEMLKGINIEPVTRDDQGNIIPPSQRFQPTEEDIRYARRERDLSNALDSGDFAAAQALADGGATLDRTTFLRSIRPAATQRATTIHTRLEKDGIISKDEFANEQGLVYGDGRGAASQYLGAQSYEPYPPVGFEPTYTGDRVAGEGVPIDKKFRTILNTFVLNVVDPETRAFIVKDIANLLVNGGRAIFVTRGKDVATSKALVSFGPLERIQRSEGKLTYQKGFTQPELIQYLQETLGEGFKVRALRGGSASDVRVEVVKNTDATLDNPPLVQESREGRRIQMPRPAGMETEAVTTKLESLGFGRGGIVSVVNEPDASFEGRTIIRDGKVVGIELNAAALKDDAAVERVLNHEIAESANADGALNRLVAGLTPKERKEINDAITRLGYAERARTAEEAARAVELLAEGWRGRRWFERAVARIEAWANKLGYKLTRRAAEYIAARNVSEINDSFKQAYNKFINVRGEAREGRAFVTPAENARFLELAKNPEANREELQKMVDVAAKKAGFKVFDWWHGTKKDFNVFKATRYEDGLIFFSSKRDFSERWARNRKPNEKILERIESVRSESRKIVNDLFEADPRFDPKRTRTEDTPEMREAAEKYLEAGKEFERSKLDGMTWIEAEREMGVRIVHAYLKADRIFDPSKDWREVLPAILNRLGIKSEAEIEKQSMDMLLNGNYLIWEDKKLTDAVFEKFDAMMIQEDSDGPMDTIAVRDPSLIKMADPVTRDDQGNVIPLSERFQPTTPDIRYSIRESNRNAGFTFKITADDARELQYKIGTLLENPDLQVDYNITTEQARQIYNSIPTTGGDWNVPAWADQAVRGELEDQSKVLSDMADDARSENKTGDALRLSKQAKRFKQWSESISVVRESRREDAIPTFSEGSPEASTLSTMAASMAKVDAASEAKPNPENKPTYKISEIASVWMDQGGDARQLQDMVVEYTNLTPANAKRVANAIAKQYDIQQSIKTAFLETPAGVSVEALPEGVTLPKEVDPDRPRPVMQRLFDVFMGVRVKPVKITGDEKALLKSQIRLKAAANRAAKQEQQRTADEVVEIIKSMELRGPVRPKQAQALAKRAAKVIWTSEKSMESFVEYAAKVVENANYDADLREAKAAQKRAKELSKQKKVAMSPQRLILQQIGNVAANKLEDPRMFAEMINYYLRGFKDVRSPNYVVVPDEEITGYISQLETESVTDQAEVERETNERLARKYDLDPNTIPELMSLINIIEEIEGRENREALESILTDKAIETQDGLRGYDTTALTNTQKKLVESMLGVDLKSINNQEKQMFIRIANNMIYNNQTNGAEYFVATAKGQQNARKAAQDSKMIQRNKAWIPLIPSFGSLKLQETLRNFSLELQSVADTFRNVFGKDFMAKAYEMMGMLDLNEGFTKANNTIDEIQDLMAEFHQGNEKKYGDAARNQDGILSEGVAGFLIQEFPFKDEATSIEQRRNLINEYIANARASRQKDRVAMADRVEVILNKIDGASVQEILNNMKREYRPNYDSLMWYKDVLFPKYKDFLKQFDENFNDQANNYDSPNYLPIAFTSAGPALALTTEDVSIANSISLQPKQSVYTIKRQDYTTLPKDRDGNPKEIEFNLRRNAFNSLSDQINKAYTNPAWQQIFAFMKTPESIEFFGDKANRDFFVDRLNRLRVSRARRGSVSGGALEKALDSFSIISRKLGTGIALGGVFQWIKQPPDQLLTALGSGGRADLLAKNVAPSTQKAARELLNLFSIGRRGDSSAGYKYINQMEGHQSRMERYFSESKWEQAKEQGGKIADVWMVALKKSDFIAASAAWMTYYEGELNKNDIKIDDWAKEAELVKTDPVRRQAAAFAEQMTDIYQGSSDPTSMATFAQSGKTGWENFTKALLVPFNSFAIQQRMRLYSDARDALNGTSGGKGGLAGTIGGLILFHTTKRFVLPVISGGTAAILYGMLGVDMEEPDEEKQKEMADRNWRQFLADITGNLLVGGTPQIVENRVIEAFNYASYMVGLQLESETVLDENGEIMSFDKYSKERSPFYRYKSYDNAMSFGMFDIGFDQAKETALQTKMLMDREEMEMYTPEEQRLLYFSALSEWLYLMRLNDTDFARIVKKARKDMIKSAEEREKELARIRAGR